MLEETYNLGAEFFFTGNNLKILLCIIWKEGSYFAQRKKSLTLGIHSQAPFKALNLERRKGTLRLEPRIKALSKVLTFILQCRSQEESLEPNYLFVGAISPGQLEVDVIDMHTSFWRGNGFGRWTITWNQSKYWKCHQCSTFSGTSLNSIEHPQLIDLVRSYKDSFIRSYDEMFDLSQDIGVHLLKVKRDSPYLNKLKESLAMS